ncbi:MAG: glycosyltransferase family 4 protein, partial [Ruminococcus sp.]|nr:glycosyltransferase family 4 protein [Ruminococcus sp.]
MGGGQNLLISLAGEQQRRGNDVTVLQLVKSEDPTVSDKITARGVKVLWVVEHGSPYSPSLIFKVMPYLTRGKYDIVHVHLFPALYWVGFAKLLKIKTAPIVYTEHSTKNNRRTNFFLRNVDKFIYQNCYKRIIACADKALETYLQVYPNIKHACAINNGVDTRINAEAEPYTKRELLGINEDNFVVTMVASFLFMKRQDTIVEAISKLPEKFHAVFVGGNKTDEGLLKVKKLAEDLQVADRVHFLYLRPDVPRILKTSDVVMMSSEHEGLSLSSIEGMAAGKPFVAT